MTTTPGDTAREPTAAAPAAAGERPLRPRDAATLVVVDDRGGAARILMGKRRADLVFMPGKYVFPGGRVDAADRLQATADELEPGVASLLLHSMKGRPSSARARGLALAALREAFEETGVVLGTAAGPPAGAGAGTGAAAGTGGNARRAAGGRAAETWDAFHATGYRPALGSLSLLARAITPPGRPRRYDTRFFLAPAAAIAAATPHRDEELSHIDWFTLDEVRALDLPVITRAIVEDLASRLSGDAPAAWSAPVPFYYFQAGAFRRRLLAADGSATDPVVWRR